MATKDQYVDKNGNLMNPSNTEHLMLMRYSLKNKENTQCLEDREDIYMRLAKKFSRNDTENEKRLYTILKKNLFMFGGRSAANADRIVPNCVVLTIKDDLQDILGVLQVAGALQKAGCGLGFCFGPLRPADDPCITYQGKSSGTMSFAELYNYAFGVIKQQGRHGANMATMPIDHPDILEFILAKSIEGKFRNFNFSVLITDHFMNEVKLDMENPQRGIYWKCQFNGKEYKPRMIYRKDSKLIDVVPIDITALELFTILCEQAHKNGEPGLLFPERAFNPFMKTLGKYITTNPCGEQYLHNGDVCNLGSVNFGELVTIVDELLNFDFWFDNVIPENIHRRRIIVLDKNGICSQVTTSINDLCVSPLNVKAIYVFHQYNSQRKLVKIDMELLSHVVSIAIDAMDNVIDHYIFPIPDFEKTAQNHRRIGLGMMGVADMFLKAGIGYGEPIAMEILALVMDVFNKSACKASEELAEKYGVFPSWSTSYWGEKGIKRRNAAVTCCAPTGSIALLIAMVMNGIEPFFNLAYQYDNLADKNAKPEIINPYVKEWCEFFEIYITDDIMEDVKMNGIFSNMKFPKDMRPLFACAMDLTPEQHIRIQSTTQKYLENSISKTINYPKDATVEDIKKGIMLMYDEGCWGGTVYVDESRQYQVLYTYASSKKRKTFIFEDFDVIIPPTLRAILEKQDEEDSMHHSMSDTPTLSPISSLSGDSSPTSIDEIYDKMLDEKLSSSGQLYTGCRNGSCSLK